MRQATGLWQQPDFVKLWAGQTISLFGSHIGASALHFTAILVLGASPLQLSLLLAAQMAPALLLSMPAGVWTDRLRRRPILIAADILRGLLLLWIPLAFVLGMLRMEQLYLVAALTSALSLFFDIAYEAYLPAIIERDRLVDGNSKLGLSSSVAEIAGPPLGGGLVQVLSAPLAIVFDALSFFASALSLSRIAVREPAPQAPWRRESVWSEARAGLSAIRRHSLLRLLLTIGMLRALGGGMIGPLYALFLVQDLGLAPWLVGLTIGVGGVAALAGASLAGLVVRRAGIGPAIGLALLVISAAGLLMPLAGGPPALCLAMLLLAQASDAAHTIYNIASTSLRQAATPERLLGRVNACLNLLTAGAALAGAVAAGLLAGAIGTRAALGLGVLAGAVACLPGLHASLRQLRQPPLPAVAGQPDELSAASLNLG